MVVLSVAVTPLPAGLGAAVERLGVVEVHLEQKALAARLAALHRSLAVVRHRAS